MARGLLWVFVIVSFVMGWEASKTSDPFTLEQEMPMWVALMVLALCESIEKLAKKGRNTNDN